MSAQPSLGVVIVNYNAGRALTECVESLYQHHDGIAAVVVIDNNSSDASIQQLTETVAGVQIVINDSNVGFAAACNEAAKRLDTEYLAFVNPDCVFTQPVIGPLMDVMSNWSQAGIVGCRIDNLDGTEQLGSRRYLPTLFKVFNTYTRLAQLPVLKHGFKGVNRIHENMPHAPISVEAVSGAFFLIKTDVFRALKGFDSDYPLHFEDLDLFQRVKNAGHDIVFDPRVTVQHHKGLSSTDTRQIRAWKKQGLIRFFAKHRSGLATALVRLMVRIFP